MDVNVNGSYSKMVSRSNTMSVMEWSECSQNASNNTIHHNQHSNVLSTMGLANVGVALGGDGLLASRGGDHSNNNNVNNSNNNGTLNNMGTMNSLSAMNNLSAMNAMSNISNMSNMSNNNSIGGNHRHAVNIHEGAQQQDHVQLHHSRLVSGGGPHHNMSGSNSNNNNNGILHTNHHHHHIVSAAPTIKNHSVTHFNGFLYCFGGYDGRRNHMTLLLYSIEQQRWIRPFHVNSPVPTSMLMLRSHSNAMNATNSTSSNSTSTNNHTNNTNNSITSSMATISLSNTQPQQRQLSSGSLNSLSSLNSLNQTGNNLTTSSTDAVSKNTADAATVSAASVSAASVLAAAASAAAGGGGDASIVVQGMPPPGRNGHSATLAIDPDDEDHGRIIIIGGWLGTGPLAASDMHVLDITHVHDNPSPTNSTYSTMNNSSACRQLLQWYQPAVKGTPPGACNMHSADYVISRKEVYVFRGGNGREYLNDLHALHVDTLTWRKVHCTGAIPQQRANHSSAILDYPPINDNSNSTSSIAHKSIKSELFIFGGWNGTERLNDIHILDTETSNWTAPHVAGVLPHPRAGMTLTALRGRLYLFGGSGTSAKCFQDLQILDRHEMAWLDVVSEGEQNGSNINCHSTNSSINNTGGSNNQHHLTELYPYDSNRFRFGGSRMYGRSNNSYHHHNTLLDDPSSDSSSLLFYGGGTTANSIATHNFDVEARPQQGGTQEFGNSWYAENLNNNTAQSSTYYVQHQQQQQQQQNHMLMGDTNSLGFNTMASSYASPNPNDEDTVPSVFVRGHGPGRRAGHTATAVNRKIYIFGGSCGSDYLNDFFVLDTDPPPSAYITEANPLLLMERRLRHFFNDPEFADVVFVVGDEKQKVYGHKMILSIVSDCFRAMFTNGFKESAAMEITIPDCSFSAFLAVMEYIYTGRIVLPSTITSSVDHSPHNHTASRHNDQNRPLDLDQVIRSSPLHTQNLTRIVEMLELADRFFLDHLKQICESILQSAVNRDTVEYLFSVAQKTNSTQLQAICLHFSRNNNCLFR